MIFVAVWQGSCHASKAMSFVFNMLRRGSGRLWQDSATLASD